MCRIGKIPQAEQGDVVEHIRPGGYLEGVNSTPLEIIDPYESLRWQAKQNKSTGTERWGGLQEGHPRASKHWARRFNDSESKRRLLKRVKAHEKEQTVLRDMSEMMYFRT